MKALGYRPQLENYHRFYVKKGARPVFDHFKELFQSKLEKVAARYRR